MSSVELPVVKSNGAKAPDLRLVDIDLDQIVELVRIDLPEEQMVPLLELGVMPGCHLCPVRHSPSGDPIVMVDGSMLALRRSMADCLCVKLAPESSTT
jgi:Fe2+ transport system protein FeoA